jgi:recombination protein RecA
VTVKKNKVAPPFRTAEFDIMYNEGISAVGDLLDLAVSEEIVVKRGAFYSYGDIRLGQGRENAKAFLAENPDLAAEIDRLVRQQHGMPVVLEPKAQVRVPVAAGVEENSSIPLAA